MNVLVNWIFGENIIVEITLVMDVALGPASMSKTLKFPVDKNITLWRLLVEMDETSWMVASPLSLIVIIMLVMTWFIKADSVSTFVSKWNSLRSTWPESCHIVIVHP